MKVLITGAFGNLGLMCIEQALSVGLDVRCFDRRSSQTLKQSRRYGSRIETFFGDITDYACHASLVSGVDAIIHNACLLPPQTENDPSRSWQVNVEGTLHLATAAQRANPMMRFVFPSSVTVYGGAVVGESPRTLDDSVYVSDEYTRQKLTCEEALQKMSLEWVILRVGVSVDARTLRTDWDTFKQLLNIRPDNPLEYVHPKDVALAMCNALTAPQASRKTFLIGGGPACQTTQHGFLSAAMNACGLSLSPHVFGHNNFYTHWMDTRESQRILNYQRHSFSAYRSEMQRALVGARLALWPVKPVVNYLLEHFLFSLREAR